MNKHLGTEGLNIQGLVEAAFQQNMGIDDAMAIVEKDGWKYDFQGQTDVYSYVCSAYVLSLIHI